MLADLMYNLKYWTPRAALLVTGLVLLALPTPLGAFLRSSRKGEAGGGRLNYILPAAGLTAMWMSEAWPSNWKQPADGLLGVGLLLAGLPGVVAGGKKARKRKFLWGATDRKQSLVLAALGLANMAAAWWPRPWRDYEWATGWSSGLPGTPEPPEHYTGQRG
jgi:hypothetical protein